MVKFTRTIIYRKAEHQLYLTGCNRVCRYLSVDSGGDRYSDTQCRGDRNDRLNGSEAASIRSR